MVNCRRDFRGNAPFKKNYCGRMQRIFDFFFIMDENDSLF